MTESQLDNLLIMAYYPRKVEKINLSNDDIFINFIMKRISDLNLKVEFGEAVVSLFPPPYNNMGLSYECLFVAALADLRLFKMAALKTYDENRELAK